MNLFLKLSLLLFFMTVIAFGQVNDGFENGAAGWSNQGTPTTGNFVLGNPIGTTWQPENDHTPSGVNAIYTATNPGGEIGVDDVDGGSAILQSPIYNVATASTFSIWYFFGQRDAGGDANDFFRLEYSLDGGTSYTTLVFIGDVVSNPIWRQATTTIPAGSNLRIRVWASDGTATGDIIEAGIDDLSITQNVPVLNIDNVTANEDEGNATFTVTHSNSNASGPFTVNFSTQNGIATAGNDYSTTTGTINFNGTVGDTETITVPIIDDTDLETLDETFSVEFTSSSDTSVDISDVGNGTIVDDDLRGNTPLVLNIEFNGHYDYTSTGGSLRTLPNNNGTTDACTITNTSQAPLLGDIPAGAKIARAFLYWAHSSTVPDNNVTFDGQSVTSDDAYTTLLTDRRFYGYVSDVTDIVENKENVNTADFTFTDLNIDNDDDGPDYCATSTVLGGWGLMVFYEEPSLPVSTINLYQGFDGISDAARNYTLDSFYAISGIGAKASFLSWEGDADIAGAGTGTVVENLSVSTPSFPNQTLSGDGGQTGNNPYNSTVYDNTVAGPPINITNTYGLDWDTFDLSGFLNPADSEITATVAMGQDFVISNAVVLKVQANLISGRVFEDMNYPGGIGRSLSASTGSIGIEGATVELYNSGGTLINTTTTDFDGNYDFGGMADGTFTVRIVNQSVRSMRGGGSTCTSCYGIQTFRTAYDGTDLDQIIDEVGGSNPAATNDTTPGTLTGSQTSSTIVISNGGIANIDFGFNFNTIVNSNENGQGSLEQFIVNSNNLDETTLDIEPNSIFDPVAGEDTSIFMIPPSGDALGRPADSNFSDGVFDISVTDTNSLSIVTGDNTKIDGRTQTAYSGDTNTGTVGSGGVAIGISGGLLPTYEQPEIQVHRNAGDVLRLDGLTVVVRNLSVFANNNAGIRIQNGSATVSGNLLGVNANGINNGDIDFGVEITGGIAIVGGNYIATNTDSGIFVNGGTSTIIQDNHIFSNGDSACQDNINLSNGAGIVIQRNLIENSAAMGIDGESIYGSVAITENTITGSGQDGGDCGGTIQNAGIRLGGSNSFMTHNIIHSNGGAGIVLDGGSTVGNLISENSIYANGTTTDALGIDLDSGGSIGDGVTLNDTDDADVGPNGMINYPIIFSAYYGGTNLTIEGWSRPGALIELFLTDIDQGTATPGDNQLGLSTDYGEGQVFLTSFVEGSTIDSDSQISNYIDNDGNMDNTNKFSVSIPLPGISLLSSNITATATIANSTSEFSPQSVVRAYTVISNRRITHRVNKD